MTAVRVLIVEDEAVVRLHLRRLVEGLGHAVVAVCVDAEGALEAAGLEKPDAALVDVRLEGEMDGLELARELERRYGVAIVFVTAFADERTLAGAARVEAHGFVVKPFSEAQLRAALTVALATHRRRAGGAHSPAMRDLVARLGDAVVLMDSSGRVTYLNPLAEQMLGIERAAASARPFASIANLSTDDGDAETWFGAPRGRPVPENLTAMKLVAGGSSRPVSVEVLPLTEAESGGWAVVVHDESPVDPGVSSEPGAEARGETEPIDIEGMMGRSEGMLAVFDRIVQLAPLPWSVLIEGETGTGKELAARALHALSRRSQGPFVAVNCAGMTDSLLGSQLFGHRRGAFTGAMEHQVGVFEAAHTGTLFLDEIGDVSPVLQKSILRVLDDGCVVRLGETSPRRVDVRVICATQADLEAEVEAGRFRADLLFRLRGARLRLPPLRARGDDVELLARHFLARSSLTLGRPVTDFSPEALRLILAYRWPGNVRELRSAVDHAALSCGERVVQAADLPPEVSRGDPIAGVEGDERDRIVAAIRQAKGNRSRAALMLGISRATLYRRITQLGLPDE